MMHDDVVTEVAAVESGTGASGAPREGEVTGIASAAAMPDAVGSDDSSSRDGARAPSLRPPEPLGSPPQESDCSEAAGERDGAEDVEEGSGAEDCAVKLGAASSDTLVKNAGLVELSSASSLRDVRRETSTVKASLYVSELRQNGFAVLVSDCHHVLELPQALLPSDCQQGDVLSFALRRDEEASASAERSMNSIQTLLLEASGGPIL